MRDVKQSKSRYSAGIRHAESLESASMSLYVQRHASDGACTSCCVTSMAAGSTKRTQH